MANIEQAIRSSYSNLSGRGCYFLLARFSQGNEIDQLHASTHCASRVNSTVDEIRSPQACKVFVRATGRMTRIMEQKIDGMWVSIMVVALSDLHTNVFRRAIKRERHH